MTEQNQTPDTGDDVEGHQKRRDDAFRDDTEGHMRHREDARKDDAHQDEGKKHFRRDANDGDDSEGHLHRI